MKRHLRFRWVVLFQLLFILLANSVLAQEKKYTISGVITDGNNGESLIGATVQLINTNLGTVTNTYGFYSLSAPAGSYTLRVSYIGFSNFEQEIKLTSDLKFNASLTTKAIEAQMVVISGNATKNVESTEMSRINLDIEKIKALPAFLGEVDLIKTIQLLPGVMSAGEGNNGLYVRGGGPDQNLILVDDAVVYNASHLFGFFSIFNADAVKNVELIKGGMPAQYGGRLASVLDINLKEGNSKKFQVDGGIGLIASRLTIQGPIKKDKSSFIFSGRRTYIDVLAKPFIPKTSNAFGSGYYFYDFNGKINYQFNDRNQVYLSGYYGKDKFSFVNRRSDLNFTIPWGNATVSARWNHLFSDRLFLTTSLTFSDYNFQFRSRFDQFSATFYSGIRDYTAKVAFSYFPVNKHVIKFGAIHTRHIFTPNIANARSGDAEFNLGGEDKIYGHESGVYVSDEFDLSSRIKVAAGLRLSHFIQVGPFTRYQKDLLGRTTGSVKYDDFEKVVAYTGLEPRLSVRYALRESQSLKASYTRNLQFIQLASISPLNLPTDIWIPSSELLKPQIGNQIAAGYFRNFSNNKYETSVEVYYKDLQNLIEYRNGAQPEDNLGDNVDNNLIIGSGESYGLEVFLKKVYGDFNGWIGYTLSKTTRRFDEINDGAVFAAKYDRRHDLSVALTYNLNAKWSFGSVFIFGTGARITLPVSRYYSVQEARFVDVFGPRNATTMAAYHRLDLSATYQCKTTKTVKNPETGEYEERPKKVRSNWNFSIYNLYNRRNPYFLYNDFTGTVQEGTSRVVLKQVSLFPVLPSVTWNFSF
ncbi:MAG TPA: TonB-dependent receptor [Luteibaculaceae bacterium]|nr:TonB-dependent receptor [Luteibaculaceae bacterium]